MSVPPTVLYDANVLYPSFLRDFLIRLARTGAVRARWTEAIHQEWIRSLLRNRPDLPSDRLLALKDLINASVPDCLVEDFARRIGGEITVRSESGEGSTFTIWLRPERGIDMTSRPQSAE